MLKTYGELCAVARALDVVGERWTLLLVRELLIEPALRFSELQRRLPGIAPNLLTQRLRDLETEGVVAREDGPGGAAVYTLTPRGAQLDGVIRELLRWGAPTVPSAPADAIFQMHWLSMPARHLLRDREPAAPPVRLRFGSLADGFDVQVAGELGVMPCVAGAAVDAVIDGPGPLLVGLLQGAVPLDTALAGGVTLDGERAALERVLPRPAGAA